MNPSTIPRLAMHVDNRVVHSSVIGVEMFDRCAPPSKDSKLPPRISVVTPSFNQGKYIERTIRSVLDQGYQNLEYIIIDGGSTDESVAIIRKYEERLAYWHSEPDRGQSDAIAQGFARATGDILCWINSDDYYHDGALSTAADVFSRDPEAAFVYGDYHCLYPNGELVLKKKVSFDFDICLYSYLMIPQPSAFWRRRAYFDVGGVDRSLHYVMDYDLFLRMGRRLGRRGFRHLRQPLSVFRIHEASKSVSCKERFAEEGRRITEPFMPSSASLIRFKRKYYLAKCLAKFALERRFVPLRKDKAKV